MFSYNEKGLSSVIKSLASNRFKNRFLFFFCSHLALKSHASSFPKGLQNTLQPVLIIC